ncbi:hypothetical protein [Bombilactobacillus bombi]|uniref:hypothetical protein n=1 Tax=Bombilactobacillus bombi TaxID=1303590 RepID=UPI0015E5EDC8|nr:hypothetical protein [Bombilactobacillus bombi]MBA1434300.1 hypothetical protein [Bombilactobacillus bombi]
MLKSYITSLTYLDTKFQGCARLTSVQDSIFVANGDEVKTLKKSNFSQIFMHFGYNLSSFIDIRQAQ